MEANARTDTPTSTLTETSKTLRVMERNLRDAIAMLEPLLASGGSCEDEKRVSIKDGLRECLQALQMVRAGALSMVCKDPVESNAISRLTGGEFDSMETDDDEKTCAQFTRSSYPYIDYDAFMNALNAFSNHLLSMKSLKFTPDVLESYSQDSLNSNKIFELHSMLTKYIRWSLEKQNILRSKYIRELQYAMIQYGRLETVLYTTPSDGSVFDSPTGLHSLNYKGKSHPISFYLDETSALTDLIATLSPQMKNLIAGGNGLVLLQGTDEERKNCLLGDSANFGLVQQLLLSLLRQGAMLQLAALTFNDSNGYVDLLHEKEVLPGSEFAGPAAVSVANPKILFSNLCDPALEAPLNNVKDVHAIMMKMHSKLEVEQNSEGLIATHDTDQLVLVVRSTFSNASGVTRGVLALVTTRTAEESLQYASLLCGESLPVVKRPAKHGVANVTSLLLRRFSEGAIVSMITVCRSDNMAMEQHLSVSDQLNKMKMPKIRWTKTVADENGGAVAMLKREIEILKQRNARIRKEKLLCEQQREIWKKSCLDLSDECCSYQNIRFDATKASLNLQNQFEELRLKHDLEAMKLMTLEKHIDSKSATVMNYRPSTLEDQMIVQKAELEERKARISSMMPALEREYNEIRQRLITKEKEKSKLRGTSTVRRSKVTRS